MFVPSDPTPIPAFTFVTFSDTNCTDIVYTLSGNAGECSLNPYTNYSGIFTGNGILATSKYWLNRNCSSEMIVYIMLSNI